MPARCRRSRATVGATSTAAHTAFASAAFASATRRSAMSRAQNVPVRPMPACKSVHHLEMPSHAWKKL